MNSGVRLSHTCRKMCAARREWMTGGDQWHFARAEEWLPLVRLSAGIRPLYDDLQSLRTVGRTRRLGAAVPQTCGKRAIDTDTDDRLDPYQGASLSIGRKKGEQKQ